MFYQQTIAVAGRINLRPAKTVLKYVAIVEGKSVEGDPHRDARGKSVFVRLNAAGRLHFNMQVVRGKRQVLIKIEDEPGANSFIDGPAEIIADAQVTEHHEI